MHCAVQLQTERIRSVWLHLETFCVKRIDECCNKITAEFVHFRCYEHIVKIFYGYYNVLQKQNQSTVQNWRAVRWSVHQPGTRSTHQDPPDQLKPMHSNTFRYIQLYSGTFRCIQIYSDAFRYIQIHSNKTIRHIHFERITNSYFILQTHHNQTQIECMKMIDIDYFR